MTFGEKLRTLRLQKKMTQQELGKQAGLGLNTISNYEKGSTYPRDRGVYARLAEILGVSADYLHNENDDFIASAAERYGYSGKKQAMNSASMGPPKGSVPDMDERRASGETTVRLSACLLFCSLLRLIS